MGGRRPHAALGAARRAIEAFRQAQAWREALEAELEQARLLLETDDVSASALRLGVVLDALEGRPEGDALAEEAQSLLAQVEEARRRGPRGETVDLREARRLIMRGALPEACAALTQIGDDKTQPVARRIEALIRLGHTRMRGGDELGAREALQSASSLFAQGPVEGRDDERLRRLLDLTAGVVGSPTRPSAR
jgi:hypothetical protein